MVHSISITLYYSSLQSDQIELEQQQLHNRNNNNVLDRHTNLRNFLYFMNIFTVTFIFD